LPGKDLFSAGKAKEKKKKKAAKRRVYPKKKKTCERRPHLPFWGGGGEKVKEKKKKVPFSFLYTSRGGDTCVPPFNRGKKKRGKKKKAPRRPSLFPEEKGDTDKIPPS